MLLKVSNEQIFAVNCNWSQIFVYFLKTGLELKTQAKNPPGFFGFEPPIPKKNKLKDFFLSIPLTEKKNEHF